MSRYLDLVRSRRCIQCRAGLLDHEVTIRCDECKSRNKKRYGTKKIKKRYARRQRKKYRRNRVELLARKEADRQQRKLDGRCRSCSADALPDSDWCRSCRHRHRKSSRESMQRTRQRRLIVWMLVMIGRFACKA